MILRPPNWLDFEFFKGCYSDWLVTEKNPPILESHIWDWINYWMNRTNEVCLVGMENIPVGFIVYYWPDETSVEVVNLVVHPDHREKGHANAIVQALRDKLVAEGAEVGRFNAVEGPIAGQVRRGKFKGLGEVEGKTGTLTRGELTADMEV